MTNSTSRQVIDAVRDILEMMTTTPDIDLSMRYILSTIAGLIGCKTSSIMLFDENGCTLAWVHGFGPDVEASIVGHRFPNDLPNLVRIQQERQPYLIDDAQVLPEWVKVKGLTWIRSTMGVPIALRDRVYGVLAADHDLPDQFTPEQMETLQIIAHITAIAMENISTIRDIEQLVLIRTAELRAKVDAESALRDQLRQLHEVTVELAAIDSLDQLCRRVVELGITRLGFDRLSLMLYDSARHQINGMFATDRQGQVISEKHIHVSIMEGHSLLRRAVRDSQRLALEENVALLDGDTTIATGWRAAAVIWSGGQPTGWLVADNALSQQPASPADLDLLALYSGAVAALITQLHTAEALRASLEREKDLSQLKSRFISMASHEFRTPLATILTSAELLERYRQQMTEEKIARRIEKIIEQTHHLARVMDDVLNLSRIQSGRVAFQPAAVDLAALTREIIDELADRPDRAPRTVDLRVAHDPFIATLDRQLIRQALSNLIGNAIKYSPDTAPIEVDLETFGSNALLRVRDHGIGIPQADLEHLFEPFHRGENVGSISGTGLGLAITRQAIEVHGGQISVESAIGVGTTFTILLPI